MIVKLDELKNILEILISKAENSKIKKIEIDNDYYWNISTDDRENFTVDQPEVCVGSLYDDLQELNKVLNKQNQPTPLDFERLGNILIFLGNKISKSDIIY